MSKKFLFFIVLFHLISSNNFVLSEIIPLKKPTQSKEVTQKKLLIDILKPLPKPIKKTETKKTDKFNKSIKNKIFLIIIFAI